MLGNASSQRSWPRAGEWIGIAVDDRGAGPASRPLIREILGIVANTAILHRSPGLDELRAKLEGWDEPPTDAAKWIATTTLTRLLNTEEHNRQRAWLVTSAARMI